MRILNDFDTSVRKALEEIDPNYMDYEALVVCGTHNPGNIKGILNEIKNAREKKTPFLGICAGHQMAAIEYARNVLGITEATSEEFGEGTFVVKKRTEGLKVGLHDGETYWNNFEVDYTLLPNFEKDKPDNFITVQSHPEYQSSKEKPHPLLVKFIELCKKNGNVE